MAVRNHALVMGDGDQTLAHRKPSAGNLRT